MNKIIAYKSLDGNLYESKDECDIADKSFNKKAAILKEKERSDKSKQKHEADVLSKLFVVKTAAEFEDAFNKALCVIRGSHFKGANFKFRWYGVGVDYWSKRPIITGNMTGSFTPKKPNDFSSSNIYGMGCETGTGYFSPNGTNIGFSIFLDKYENLSLACKKIQKEKEKEILDGENTEKYYRNMLEYVESSPSVVELKQEKDRLDFLLFDIKKVEEENFKNKNPAPKKTSLIQEVKKEYEGFFE